MLNNAARQTDTRPVSRRQCSALLSTSEQRDPQGQPRCSYLEIVIHPSQAFSARDLGPWLFVIS